MKKTLLYWIPTVLFSLAMGMGGVMDILRSPEVMEGMKHLGYPEYFALWLGIAKVLGVAVLLVPVPRTLKEWAYAGFTFELLAASISHASVGDPIKDTVLPLIFLGILHLSYWMWRGRETQKAGGEMVG